MQDFEYGRHLHLQDVPLTAFANTWVKKKETSKYAIVCEKQYALCITYVMYLQLHRVFIPSPLDFLSR